MNAAKRFIATIEWKANLQFGVLTAGTCVPAFLFYAGLCLVGVALNCPQVWRALDRGRFAKYRGTWSRPGAHGTNVAGRVINRQLGLIGKRNCTR